MNRPIFFVTLLASILALAASAPAAENPLSLAERDIGAMNRGDAAAGGALYSDDAVMQGGPLCNANPCVGKAAIQKNIEARVAAKAHATIIGKYVSGNVAVVQSEIRNDNTKKAGVERFIVWTIFEVKGDKIAIATGIPPRTDPQTAKYLAWLRSQPPAK
jgi:hypothetical protein